MKTLVTYSSLTGNTQKVAQAISQAIPDSDIFPINECPDLTDYSLLLVGFWVDRGHADDKAKRFLSALKEKTVGFFFTLGAYPDSPHADEVVKVTEDLLKENGNNIIGSFRCQGKVDPALIEKMKKILPPDHPHAQMTEERKDRLTEAAKHPNEEDFNKAKAFADDTYKRALAEVPETIKAGQS
ncbi:MAG: flavodoxin family protein [Deltaproteobacteria bacterium]|jgi:flavodoxin|nr:flavodoxin family protein [Deltaproteobacteria bacterium]